jgi:segregation and condensation protein A
MSLNIKIKNFDGPFDLLLHLIKKSKMDIYDIKIYEITNQYLEYIHAMKEMDLEITSEFIVLAANLIEIKSKMLLPKPKIYENAADIDEQDPRKELVNKLLEYRKFKFAAEFFKQREQGLGRMFSKKPEIIEEKKKNLEPKELFKGITMLNLYEIYNKIMSVYISKMNSPNIINNKIPLDEYKISDKINYLRESIDLGEKVTFSSIMDRCTSKVEMIVTFLAMLELIKLRFMTVVQEQNFKEIYVERIEVYEEDEH